MFDQLVRQSIQELAPYTAGKNVADVASSYQGELLKLSSNENAQGVSSRVLELLAQYNMHDLFYYPDSNAGALKSAIVAHLADDKISVDNLVIGNGSNEILELLIRLLAKEQC